MSAIHGSAARLLANGRVIHQFLRELTSSADRDVHDKTTFGQTAHRFHAGLRNATLSGGGFFDGADEGSIDEQLDAALSGPASVLTYQPQGDGFGVACRGLVGSQTEYEVTSAVDDLVGIGLAVQSNVGVERLVTLHALAAEAATGNGLPIDNAAPSADGGVGYLQVTALAGDTTADVVIQHSDDDVAYVDLIAFAQATEPGGQRVEVAGTVERYVRARQILAGSGPDATYHLAFGRR